MFKTLKLYDFKENQCLVLLIFHFQKSVPNGVAKLWSLARARLSGPDLRGGRWLGARLFWARFHGARRCRLCAFEIDFGSRHLILFSWKNIRKKPFENSILKTLPFGKRASLEPEEGPGTRFWFSRNLWVLNKISNAIIIRKALNKESIN